MKVSWREVDISRLTKAGWFFVGHVGSWNIKQIIGQRRRLDNKIWVFMESVHHRNNVTWFSFEETDILLLGKGIQNYRSSLQIRGEFLISPNKRTLVYRVNYFIFSWKIKLWKLKKLFLSTVMRHTPLGFFLSPTLFKVIYF